MNKKKSNSTLKFKATIEAMFNQIWCLFNFFLFIFYFVLLNLM